VLPRILTLASSNIDLMGLQEDKAQDFKKLINPNQIKKYGLIIKVK
jgi:hypothetical protein